MHNLRNLHGTLALFLFLSISLVFPALAKELKIAHFMSPKHPMDSKVMRPLAEELEKVSSGSLTARIYPAGELGKGPVKQYKRAVDGVADITFGLQGYTSAQFPRTLLIALPGLTNGPVQATEMIWGAYDQHIKPEYGRVKMLGIWANDLAVLITSKKAVRTIADVKGMKIRAPDAVGAKAINSWGGVPVNMPVSKVYNAFNTGIVDGVLIGASGIASFKLHEIGKHFTIGIPSVVTPFYLLMNQKSWNRLNDTQKSALEEVSGYKMSIKAAKVYRAAGERGLSIAKKAGREIIKLSASEASVFRKANQQVFDEIIGDLEQKGIDARTIIKALEQVKG